jgi:hypothetical protein
MAVWDLNSNLDEGEDFLEIDQPETRIACSGHVC